jgi:hypothetical protein
MWLKFESIMDYSHFSYITKLNKIKHTHTESYPKKKHSIKSVNNKEKRHCEQCTQYKRDSAKDEIPSHCTPPAHFQRPQLQCRVKPRGVVISQIME